MRTLPIMLLLLLLPMAIFAVARPVEEAPEPGWYIAVAPVDGSPDKFEWKPWRDVTGRRVRVEGIAWDTGKGLGRYVYLDRAEVYVDLPFHKYDAIGKIVRVTGVLERRVSKGVAGSDPPAQGHDEDLIFYTLRQPQWEIIDRVTNAHMEVLK